MRLVPKLDGLITRYDRASWLTPPFDIAWGAGAVDVTPCTLIGAVYCAGATAGEVFVAGMTAGDVFAAGAAIGEVAT